MATLAPCSANLSTVARPSPDAPPVTTATLFCNSIEVLVFELNTKCIIAYPMVIISFIFQWPAEPEGSCFCRRYKPIFKSDTHV